MLAWFIEFGGSFLLAMMSLLVGNYYFYRPRTPIAYGLMSAVVVFLVVTPIFYLSGGKPFLNPASTVVSGIQGKIDVYSVLTYIVAQLLGFLAGWAFFSMIFSPR